MSAVLNPAGHPIGSVFYDLTESEKDAGLALGDLADPTREPGDVRRYGAVHGDASAAARNTAAILAALNGANGGGSVSFPAGNEFYVDGRVLLTNLTNVRVYGNGAAIKARLTKHENVWTFLEPTNVHIHDLNFDGGFSVTGFSSQILSFRHPVECVVENCRFTDWKTSAVLMFTDGGTSRDNYVRFCHADGNGVADAGFLFDKLQRSYQIENRTVGIGGTVPGYAQQLKNACEDCHIINGVAEDCTEAFVASAPDEPAEVGSGANNCTISGTAIGCRVGLHLHRSNNCKYDIVVDMEENDHAEAWALESNARNTECFIRLSLRNIHASGTAIRHSSSSDCTYVIDQWDGTGAVLWDIGDGGAQPGAKRNRLFINNIYGVDSSFNPYDYVVDNSGSTTTSDINQVVYLRDFMERGLQGNPRLTFAIPGEARTNNYIAMSTAGIFFAHDGANVFAYSAAVPRFGPSEDAALSLGASTNRWTDGHFAGRVYVGTYAKASLPDASRAGGIIYVSDEAGGAVIAFSDGTNWRRVTDRAIVS